MSATISRTEEIAGTLRDEILRGQYRAGERLPSERDVATRFQTSRGTVREAFKKLDQLGIACVQPGGARVVPVEECTLDVLGPLLDLGDYPDPVLVDQVLEVLEVLMGIAAQAFVEKADGAELARAAAIVDELMDNGDPDPRQTIRQLTVLFLDVSGHLVLRLIANGLRMQFVSRLEATGFELAPDRELFSALSKELRNALDGREPQRTGAAMQRLVGMFRENVHQYLEEATQGKGMSP